MASYVVDRLGESGDSDVPARAGRVEGAGGQSYR